MRGVRQEGLKIVSPVTRAFESKETLMRRNGIAGTITWVFEGRISRSFISVR